MMNTRMGKTSEYIPVAFYFRVEIAEMKPLSFKEVSGLSVEMELETITEGGVNNYEHKVPKQIKHNNLILKRALRPIKYSEVRWIQKILQGDFSQAIKPKDILIKLLNEDAKPFYTWACENAFPVKWEIESLDSEKNSILIETIEFSYTTLKRL